MKHLLLIISSFLTTAVASYAQDQENVSSPRDLAQLQLEAYNAKDIDRFLSAYSDSVQVFTFPNQLQYRGITAMRKNYAGFFEQMPKVNCEVASRIVHGQTVIDHEKLTGFPNGKTIYAVAIYVIARGKIQNVYFVRE